MHHAVPKSNWKPTPPPDRWQDVTFGVEVVGDCLWYGDDHNKNGLVLTGIKSNYRLRKVCWDCEHKRYDHEHRWAFLVERKVD